MSKRNKLLIAIVVVFLIAVIYAVWLFQSNVPLDTTNIEKTTAITTNINQNNTTTPEDTLENSIIIERNRVTITSLNKWDEFNSALPKCHYFSDQCLNTLKMLILGQSEFAEFSTVKLANWEIIRDRDKYSDNVLEFNFSVTQSELNSLPVGNYKTVITDSDACTIKFIGDDPRIVNEITNLSDNAIIVRDWITSTQSWSMPEHGTTPDDLQCYCADYIVTHYNDGKSIHYSEFSRLMNEKFGVPAQIDALDVNYFESKLVDGKSELFIKKRNIFSYAQFSIINEHNNEDGTTTVTVLYYADSSRFIHSDTVEYYIGENEQILGCKRISTSDYEPLEVYNTFKALS